MVPFHSSLFYWKTPWQRDRSLFQCRINEYDNIWLRNLQCCAQGLCYLLNKFSQSNAVLCGQLITAVSSHSSDIMEVSVSLGMTIVCEHNQYVQYSGIVYCTQNFTTLLHHCVSVLLPLGVAFTALKSTLSRMFCVRSASALAWNPSVLRQTKLRLPPSLVCAVSLHSLLVLSHWT